MSYEVQRQRLCEICHLLFDRNLVSGADGNMSLRLGQDEMLITPSGVCKGLLLPEQLLVQSFDGTILEGELRSTKEAGMHGALYRKNSSIGAVMHTHAAYATALANLGGVPDDILVEVPVLLGRIAAVDYARPGSSELAEEVGKLAGSNAILLRNHGVIVTGHSLEDAFSKLDGLENAAKTIALSLVWESIPRLSVDTRRIPRTEADVLLKK